MAARRRLTRDDDSSDDEDSGPPAARRPRLDRSADRGAALEDGIDGAEESKRSDPSDGRNSGGGGGGGNREASDQAHDTASESSGYSSESGDDESGFSPIEQEAGIIISIALQNFMNHKYFQHTFNRYLNVIDGANGSGKSAICQGIQFALGATASHTGRGVVSAADSATGKKSKKVKAGDFVRDGHPGPAVVTLRLSNAGPHGYKPSELGRSITISRKISRAGTSTWSLGGEDEAMKSAKKSEIDAIIRHFNINPSNKVVVMDQDTSKTFVAGDPKTQYKFIMAATELDKAEEHLASQSAHIREARATLPFLRQQLTRLVADEKEAREELTRYDRIIQLQEDMEKLEQDLAWAEVGEKVDDLEDAKDRAAELRGSVDSNEKQLDRLATDIEQARAAYAAVEEEVDAAAAEQQKLEDRVDILNKELDQMQAELDPLRHELSGAEAMKRACAMEKKRLQTELKSLQRKQAGAASKTVRLQAAAAKATEDLARFEAQEAEAAAELDSLSEQLREQRQRLEEVESEAKTVTSRLSRVRDEVNSLQRQQTDPLAPYGTNMKSLIDAIAAHAGEFSRPPVGPLGCYVKVRDERWAKAVDQVGNSKRVWNQFLVASARDRDTLMGLARRVRARLHPDQMIISSSCGARYRTKKPERDVLTVEKAIVCPDDWAFNALVDLCSIDSTCLCENEEEVRATACILDSQSRATSFIRGVSQCVLPNGESLVFYGSSLATKRIFGDGGMRYIMSASDVPRILAEKKQQLAALERARPDVATPRGRTATLERKLRAVEKRISDARTNADRSRAEKRRHENELHAASGDNADSEEITEAQAELASVEEQLVDADRQIVQKKQALSDAERKLQPKLDEIEAAESEVTNLDPSALQAKLGAAESNRDTLMAEKSRFEADIGRKQRDVAAAEQSVSDAEKAVADEIDRARVVCNDREAQPPKEFPNKRDVARAIQQTKICQEQQQEILNGVDVSVARATWEHKHNLVEEARTNLARIDTASAEMKRSMKMRKKRVKELTRQVNKQVMYYFSQSMANKDHAGTVEIDKKKREVRLRVATDVHTRGAGSADYAEKGTSNMKGLSGGEKAFTTLSLLFAIQTVAETPFHILDEFDVFMDGQTRRIAMQALIARATEGTLCRQFILITPHGIAGVEGEIRKAREAGRCTHLTLPGGTPP